MSGQVDGATGPVYFEATLPMVYDQSLGPISGSSVTNQIFTPITHNFSGIRELLICNFKYHLIASTFRNKSSK